MFLKTADKTDKSTGKTYRYYKLCESYRIGDKIRHRTILNLGKLEEVSAVKERKLLADRIEQLIKGSQSLFNSDIPAYIEKLAHHFYARIKRKGALNYSIKKAESQRKPEPDRDYQEVDISSAKLEDCREIGGEWLCKQALDELRIGAFLKECGWDDTNIKRALLHIISRAVYPASEHKTAQWINDNSAVTELFNMDPCSINRFRLYRVSNMLNKEKERLEEFLSVRTNELFDLDDKILVYDLTNAFFEGLKLGSELAKFGKKSKEKRNDAKLVALAIVINREGFVKYSKIYNGNIADCKTLSEIVNQLSKRTSASDRKPTVVIDAGIATADNLGMLKAQGYNYVCVTRSRLKDYEMAGDNIIQLQDKRKHLIEIRWVKKPDEEDNFLYVHSQRKTIKEESMNDYFCQRYEEELDNIKNSIHKKGGTKKYEKVIERIGRIKERYPRVNKHYKIDIKHKDGITAMFSWERKLPKKSQEGVYFIRTNMHKNDEKMLWDIYNTIREVEATFRILKTDLSLRPIFHQKDKFTIAHLNLGILAYTVVNTIRYRLKSRGIHYDWQNIIRIMNTQKSGTITMEKRDGTQVNIRVCSIPSTKAQEIYFAMGYKPMPFHRKKFVFPRK